MVNKRGASHFEMVISFVFFLGFVFFLFLFLKPYDTTVLSGSVVASLYDTFEEEAHTNLTSLFLKAEYEDVEDVPCFYILLPEDIFAYAFTDSRVTNLAGTLVDSNLKEEVIGDGNLQIESEEGYFKVAISPEFNEGDDFPMCVEFTEPYILGSKLERRVISYSALQEMKERYNADYENLKVDLKVPDAFEFFIVSEEFPEIDMKNFVSGSVDVITYDYVLEVLKDNGEINNTRFTLGVW